MLRKIKFASLFALLLSLNPSSFAGEDSTYNFSWLDPDKEVYVLQNRKYRKKYRPYIQVGGGLTTSGPFVDSYVYQARFGFFPWEDWGVEFLYNGTGNSDNEIAGSVRLQGTVPYTRKIDSYYGGLLMWSPFYAKINSFNKIFYVDFMFGLGFVAVNDSSNKQEFGLARDKTLTEENHTGLIWDLGARIYLTERFNVRFDLVGVHYNAEFPTTATVQGGTKGPDERFNNYDAIFSLGFVF